MISLKPYNSFGVDASCTILVEIDSVETLIRSLEEYSNESCFILGGGSNVLFIGNLARPVFLNRIGGIHINDESDECVVVRVGGGVSWHELVMWSIKRKLGNLENLSLIPGTVGAAPMQNIGAYGEEVKSYIQAVHAVSLKDGNERLFSPEECEFAYRSSIFKTALKGQYFITHVDFELTKNRMLNLSYGAISKELDQRNIRRPTIKDVSDVVIDIRSSKLPDPKLIGNAGSFFKNPVVDEETFEQLQSKHNNLVFYRSENGSYKIPAGWLIDQLGWKGKRIGETGCYKNQALVLVNHGNASGQEIYDHALKIQKNVEEHFGIQIIPEVNLIFD